MSADMSPLIQSDSTVPYADGAGTEDALRRAGPQRLYFQVTEADLLGAVSQYLVAPVKGWVKRVVVVIQKGVTTGGNITVELATVAVSGLAVVVPNGAAIGDVYADSGAEEHATSLVAAGDAVELVLDAAFAAAGALNGFIEIELAQT